MKLEIDLNPMSGATFRISRRFAVPLALIALLALNLTGCESGTNAPQRTALPSQSAAYYPDPPVSVCKDARCLDLGAVDVDGDRRADAVGWVRGTSTQELVIRLATGRLLHQSTDYNQDSNLIAAIEPWFIELNGKPGAELVVPVDANAGLKWYDVFTWDGAHLRREPGFGPDTVAPSYHWSFGNEDDSADLVRCTTPGSFEWTKLRIPYPGPAREWARTGAIEYRFLPTPTSGATHNFREVGTRSISIDDARKDLEGVDYRYPFACRPVIPVPTVRGTVGSGAQGGALATTSPTR